jgi:hypothetical protein
MARHDHGQYVGRAGFGNLARFAGRPDPRGDFTVADGSSCGDVSQCVPDPQLEFGSAHVERQIEGRRRMLDQLGEARERRLHEGWVMLEIGLREARPQIQQRTL